MDHHTKIKVLRERIWAAHCAGESMTEPEVKEYWREKQSELVRELTRLIEGKTK